MKRATGNSALRYTLKSIVSLLLTFSMLLGMMPGAALAAEKRITSCEPETGTYHYISNEAPSIELEDTWRYTDNWFIGSSFEFDCHLADLSALTSLASVSYYTNDDEADKSQNSKNIIDLLEQFGFDDVAVNEQYDLENLENSVGVALGHKTVTDNGKDYTLIAVAPRSAGYKQEWGGNFTVGTDGLSEGFKHGRDEILRFMKQYVSDNGIEGDVKLWICGHSRGGAMGNSVAGFFAGGGAEDYIKDIKVTPENIYAYTFATPTTIIQEGTTKAQALSVEGGPRTDIDERYASDTPADPYTSTDTTVIDPHGEEFSGIHNCVPDYDLITLLPPPLWGFGHYGVDYSTYDLGVDHDSMIAELSNISEYALDRYTNGGDERDYGWKTFDLENFVIVDDPEAGSITFPEIIQQRLAGLTYNAPTREAYVGEGYQDILAALASIYGMNEHPFGSMETWTSDMGTTIKAGALTYLCYASERLQEEGRATDDFEAAAITVGDIILLISDGQLEEGRTFDPENYTVDDFLFLVMRYLYENCEMTYDDAGYVDSVTPNTELERVLLDAIGSVIPPEDLLPIIKFCIIQDETPGAPTPAENRSSLYGLLAAFMPSDSEYYPLILAIGDGSTPGPIFLRGALTVIAPEGTETLPDAADALIVQLLNNAIDNILATGRFSNPGQESFYRDIDETHRTTLTQNPAKLRRLLTYALFYSDGVAFDPANDLRTAFTFIDQASKVALAHFNEVYAAWTRANYCDYIHKPEKVEGVEPTCEKEGMKEHWKCTRCGELFLDEACEQPVDEKDLVIPKLEHEPGKPVKENVVEPTQTKAGSYDEVVYCKHCGKELSRKKVTVPPTGVTKFTITYDPSGGTFRKSTKPTELKYEKGEKIKIAEAPVREGYTFQYWKGSEYKPGDTYTVTEDHTFTAVWKKNSSKKEEQKSKKNSNKTATKSGGKTPKTGDFSSPALTVALLGCALVLVYMSTRMRRWRLSRN